ncbi:MAG TPA: inositol monophosphatase family protein [Candidatus Dormibacteraeota bacterium]|nr:inositol monophosphatase family protein [Candidatus Dormibacteraeota bacterium]
MDDAALAHELADLADAITLGRFRSSSLRVETKPDMSPVSQADREAEAAIRRRLAEARPGDAVLGEEGGGAGGSEASRRWIIDPIDGTRAYVRGMPVFATLIALEIEGSLTLGMVSAPALRRRWWAMRGEGAHADGRRIGVSAVRRVEDCVLSTGNITDLDVPRRAAVLRLGERCWSMRALGDFWSHVLVAEGSVDVAVEPLGAVWDYAALLPIVEEAGGRFTDLAGAARVDGVSAVSTNGLLHETVLEALRP